MIKLKTGPLLEKVCRELGLKNTDVAEMISRTPSNVGRIFKQDNVNTDTIDLLTEKLGVNLYRYIADQWDKMAGDEKLEGFDQPKGEYFQHKAIHTEEARKPKISLLIEIDQDKQNEVIKLLNL
ncbi:hypothetical protein PBT90_00110 [Algoriphagus halophytocola]|uniref:hypothetical protein n=1 Tax=Algoriphagus halophytocola TaxID=2991499 RepID=UPI0022DE486E|nr:hypothetical protein [Algoriphagus sp. TR-M9]WBL42352.1 hypothetical protein PBT90_16575 [Algoriphagus sp. TR-M9]WBL43111.1 hypothetical protein PBT90_00110 [Algoriphagus sp. TR-M9]